MASGAGKAAQPAGPGSALNGTAAEFPNIEQELYDYQMHSKMCKKIAQLTKVSLGGDTERGALSLNLSGSLGDQMAASAMSLWHRITD